MTSLPMQRDPHERAATVTKASFVLAQCEGASAYDYAARFLALWNLLHTVEVFGDEIDEDP